MKPDAVVLFSSAGRRVELIRCFRKDAEALGITLRVIAVDANPGLSSACREADASFEVCRSDDPAYIDDLLTICGREKVRLLIPTIDTELLPLSESLKRFQEMGVALNISEPKVIRLARNKWETAKVLAKHDVPVPKTGLPEDVRDNPHNWKFPIILKPIDGSASKGIVLLNEVKDMPPPELLKNYLAQEYWKGKEYTTNVYFHKGIIQAAVSHLRIETRAGEVSKGMTERVPALDDLIPRLEEALRGAHGALCYQAIVDDAGNAAVFEFNARFGGGFPLARHAGAPFPRWLLESSLGIVPKCHNDWRSGITMLRYDAALFTEQQKLR